jgi:hypothetical protein
MRIQNKLDIHETKLRKAFIVNTIEWWKNKHLAEFNEATKHAEKVRNSRMNKFGSDKEKEFRFELTIPSDLFNMLYGMLDNPSFLQEDWEVEWFRKTFPQFSAHKVW